jgi:hypothetical protein
MGLSQSVDMNQHHYNGLIENVRLETGPVQGESRQSGIYRLLKTNSIGSGKQSAPFLGGPFDSQLSAADVMMISLPTVIFFCVVAFYVMIAVALSYATYVDNFVSVCGDIWNIVLAAAILRLPFLVIASAFPTQRTCPSCIPDCLCMVVISYTLIAAAAIAVCVLEGIYISDALHKSDCKKLMQDAAFRTPLLSEIGIVGLIIDCCSALTLAYSTFQYWHFIFFGPCGSDYEGVHCCGLVCNC